MIEDAHDRIEERALELEEREEEIIRGHANGERSDGEAVRMLLRNYNEAVALQNALDDLNQHADMVPGYSLSNQQRDATEATLGFHRTPIRTNLALASERVDPNTEYDIRLQTSQHGYRVSILDGSTYVSRRHGSTIANRTRRISSRRSKTRRTPPSSAVRNCIRGQVIAAVRVIRSGQVPTSSASSSTTTTSRSTSTAAPAKSTVNFRSYRSARCRSIPLRAGPTTDSR